MPILSLLLASSLAALAAPVPRDEAPKAGPEPRSERVCAARNRFVPAGKLPHGPQMACTERRSPQDAQPPYPVRRTAPNRSPA